MKQEQATISHQSLSLPTAPYKSATQPEAYSNPEEEEEKLQEMYGSLNSGFQL
jgi:hypothetical protein